MGVRYHLRSSLVADSLIEVVLVHLCRFSNIVSHCSGENNKFKSDSHCVMGCDFSGILN